MCKQFDAPLDVSGAKNICNEKTTFSGSFPQQLCKALLQNDFGHSSFPSQPPNMFGCLGREGGFNQIYLHFFNYQKYLYKRCVFEVLKLLKCILGKRPTFFTKMLWLVCVVPLCCLIKKNTARIQICRLCGLHYHRLWIIHGIPSHRKPVVTNLAAKQADTVSCIFAWSAENTELRQLLR